MLFAQIPNPFPSATGTVVSQTPQVVQNVLVHKEWWEKLIDYGGMTFVTVFFLYLLYRLSNIFFEWLPKIATKIIAHFDSAEARADRNEETGRKMSESLAKGTDNQRELALISEKLGEGVKDVRSFSIRNEEFLIASLETFESYITFLRDPSVKIDWQHHLDAMRRSLLNSRR